MKITRKLVNEKLAHLHDRSRAGEMPTAEPVYHLPRHLYRNAIDSGFSQESMQALSDHIGNYLCLWKSIRVTVGIESSEHMLADPSTIDEAGKIGIYRVRGPTHREIKITKKARFGFWHVMAILVHESMHNYLDSHGIRISDSGHNEVLTDVATAYYGLGCPVLRGYQPIKWTSDHWRSGDASGHMTHKLTIGYVPASLIGYAIYRTALIRNQPEFRKICPLLYRVPLEVQLWRLSIRISTATKEMDELIAGFERAKTDFETISQAINLPPDSRACEVGDHDSKLLVELYGLVTTGEFSRDLVAIRDRLERNKACGSQVPESLMIEVDTTCERVQEWKVALGRAKLL